MTQLAYCNWKIIKKLIRSNEGLIRRHDKKKVHRDNSAPHIESKIGRGLGIGSC